MIRMLLHGCCGKMGTVVRQIAAEDAGLEIVAGVDKVSAGEMPFPVYSSLEECQEEADVILDFSTASAVDALLSYAVRRKTPVVVCTTGLSEEQMQHLQETALEVAVLRSANMSLGINLLCRLVAEAAKVLYGAGFDIEILEKHHNQKVDAPSGTALALAEAANEALGGELEIVTDRSGVRRKRDRKELGISSLRGGSIVGEHEVYFAGTDEVITLHHSAASRAVFAKGGVAAAKFLAGKAPGLYTMSDVIG